MTRYVVTGAAGFIGSNIVKGLNARGIDDIIAVDDLTQGDKFRNLADLKIADYADADLFYDLFAEGYFGKVEAVFHEGACSDTMETDGKYMMDNNYTLSCGLFNACRERGTRLLYASSAATYGGSHTFRESPQFEQPLNVYGYSKLLFDQRMRRQLGEDFATRVVRQSGEHGHLVTTRDQLADQIVYAEILRPEVLADDEQAQSGISTRIYATRPDSRSPCSCG